MKYLLTALSLLIIAVVPAHAESDEVNLTCRWTVYDHMLETFVIDLKKKKVFWVNQEEIIEPTELNEGFLKFSGIKHSVEIAAGSLFNVPIEMKINRVNGAFHVLSDQVKTDRVGFCEVGKLF